MNFLLLLIINNLLTQSTPVNNDRNGGYLKESSYARNCSVNDCDIFEANELNSKQSMEFEKRFYTSDDKEQETGPELSHMWTTPLLITFPTIKNLEQFNLLLSNYVLEMYSKMMQSEEFCPIPQKESNTSEVSNVKLFRGDHINGTNEQFFQWQRIQHAKGKLANEAYQDFISTAEISALYEIVTAYSKAYFESIGKDIEWISSTILKDKLFCWASISSNGNFHMSHTHPENSISTVYYIRIPDDSAPIIFDDPRGPRWPFDGRYILHPKPGHLVIFPSWLSHQVTVTKGRSPRISFSCNIPGSWTDTSDINLK